MGGWFGLNVLNLSMVAVAMNDNFRVFQDWVIVNGLRIVFVSVGMRFCGIFVFLRILMFV